LALKVYQMSRRFFVSSQLQPGMLSLRGDELHHLVRVLRIGVGDTVTLFDGTGNEAEAAVIQVADDAVVLSVGAARPAGSESEIELVLAMAVPKGDRFGWLVEKATELGVRRLVPLLTERSVVIPGDGKLDKMRRTIIEACKQCRRAQLMVLDEPQEWPAFVASVASATAFWVAHPSGAPLHRNQLSAAGHIAAAIGPEGGFTDREIEQAAESGATLISLGPRILRIETAALAVAALACVPMNA
jgi:16S rRNA (uracil1498-N3)-methyltransferase